MLTPDVHHNAVVATQSAALYSVVGHAQHHLVEPASCNNSHRLSSSIGAAHCGHHMDTMSARLPLTVLASHSMVDHAQRHFVSLATLIQLQQSEEFFTIGVGQHGPHVDAVMPGLPLKTVASCNKWSFTHSRPKPACCGCRAQTERKGKEFFINCTPHRRQMDTTTPRLPLITLASYSVVHLVVPSTFTEQQSEDFLTNDAAQCGNHTDGTTPRPPLTTLALHSVVGYAHQHFVAPSTLGQQQSDEFFTNWCHSKRWHCIVSEKVLAQHRRLVTAKLRRQAKEFLINGAAQPG